MYPYGIMAGKTIEYDSTWVGGSAGSSYGLNDSRDTGWRDDHRGESFDYDPDASNVTRWLPPVDGQEIGLRISNSSRDFTDIYNRIGDYPRTRLWPGDHFWPPACARMTTELRRLFHRATAPYNEGKVMEVMVKHYGATFPDEHNYNATVWTYIHAIVMSVGTDPIASFSKGCEKWFGELAAISAALHPLSLTWTPWITDGVPVMDKNKTVTLPPQLLMATAGGIRAIQDDDGSNFTMWIVPNYEL